MQILALDLGPEAKLALTVEAGELKLAVTHKGANGGEETLSVAEPVTPLLDALVDKVEQLIPGDQTGLAAMAKAALEQALK